MLIKPHDRQGFSFTLYSVIIKNSSHSLYIIIFGPTTQQHNIVYSWLFRSCRPFSSSSYTIFPCKLRYKSTRSIRYKRRFLIYKSTNMSHSTITTLNSGVARKMPAYLMHFLIKRRKYSVIHNGNKSNGFSHVLAHNSRPNLDDWLHTYPPPLKNKLYNINMKLLISYKLYIHIMKLHIVSPF